MSFKKGPDFFMFLDVQEMFDCNETLVRKLG